MALSLQTTKPATPSKFNPFGDTSSGIIGSVNKAVGFSTPQAPAPIQQGTNQGQLPPSFAQQNVGKTTVDTSGTKTTTQAAKSNPSVLAQQQALNKLGAGLVEDGLAGPKTSAAIAKYGSSGGTSTPTPQTNSTPTPSDYSGNNPSAHGFVGTQNTAPEPSIPNSQPQTPTYAGYVGALGDQSGSQNNQNIQAAQKGLLGTASTNSGNSGPAYDAYQQSIKELQDLQNSIAGQSGGIESQPISMQFQQGKEQALARQNASLLNAAQAKVNQAQQAIGYQQTGVGLQQSGYSQAGNLGVSGQGQAQSALSSAAGFAAPQFPNYQNAQFDPITGTYKTVGGGQYGSGPGAAANISSIGDAQSKINNIDTNSTAIDNNFSRAINYATAAGLTGNAPILSGLQNKFGTNFATNPAVIGFNQSVQALNTLLQQFGEAPIDINTATAQTLQQAQQTVKKNLEVSKSNAQGFIDKFNSGGSSGNSTGGGGLYDF